MENKFFVTRRKAIGLAAAGFAAPFIVTRAQAAASPVLVELFTSQGCSDCPPADKFAGELKTREGVEIVTLNVDYWDYLGWKDTLGKPEYSKRQMDYAHSRGDMDVYTPQMVINGQTHEVGSNKANVSKAIALARNKAPAVGLQIQASETEIAVDLPAGPSGSNATLWVMAIAPEVNVKIQRGENSGANITYYNVARHLVNAGTWNGTAATLKLPRSSIFSGDSKSCIAVLQQGIVGPVLGLVKLKL